MEKFNKFQEKLQLYYNFDVKYKNESLFMKMLSYVLFFNKKFSTSFATTIGKTIYFPSRDFVSKDQHVSAMILAHELIHVRQKNTFGNLVYSMSYLVPQIFSIFAVFSFLSLWCLLFLLFLLPIPAPFRKDSEFGANVMTIYMFYLYIMNFTQYTDIDGILEDMAKIRNSKFTGSEYYFMWPFGVDFSEEIKDIKSGYIEEKDKTYPLVKRLYLESFK